MPNSAFTPTYAQNLQDASATQSGLVNTTAQTFAGKKTLDGGALIKGDTTGNAIASGYVGEVIKNSYSSGAVSGGIGPGNAVTLTLPSAGVWRITANGSFVNSSSYVNSAASIGIAITTTSGKDPNSVVATENESCSMIKPFASNNNMNVQVSCSVDSYTGSGPVYVTLVSSGYTSGSQAAYVYAKAVRIA